MAQDLPPVYIDESPSTQPLPPAEIGSGAPAPIALPPATVDLRTDKANQGLGEILQQDPKDIKTAIASGQEQDYRNSAASQLNFQAAMRKQQAVIDLSNKQGGNVTPDQYNDILTGTPAVLPDDVIENAYATKYISSLNTANNYMGKTVLSDAAEEIPEQLQQKQAQSTELVAKLEFAKTMGENLDAEVHEQGWVPYLADRAKTLFQPYNEAKMRGLNPQVGAVSGGLLLGDNMKAQADELFMRPMAEYKKGLTDIVTKLRKDNPTLARQFVDYVENTSETDRKLQNVFTMLTPLDYAQGLKMTGGLARKIDVFNRTNKAFKDMVVSSSKVGEGVPTRAVMAEGAGNNGEAAVIRAGDSVVKDLQGTLDPVQDVKEKLTSNFTLDGSLLDANPGNLSKAEMTILKDGFYQTSTNLYDTIMKALRVNRTPAPLASEEALRAFKDVVRSKYPGLDEAILDIGSPNYDQATNTYHIPVTFGNHGRDLFSSPEVARDFASRYGFSDPRIMDATGNVQVQPSRFGGSKTDLNVKTRLEKSIPETERVLRQYKSIARNQKSDEVTKVDARERIKSIQEILDRDKVSLKDVNSRVTLLDPVVEQNGLGYKFTVLTPYKETDESVRSWLIKADPKKAGSTSSAEGFNSWKNSVLGWIRGADDTLSYNESLQRKVATYTQGLFKEWSQANLKDIEAVANKFKWNKPRSWLGAVIPGNQMFHEFNETLKFAKTPHPVTGERGWFFRSPGDLQDHYQRFYRRLPTFEETKAYFAYVKLTEGNRVLSELAEFRNRARLGAEQHQLSITDGKTKVVSGYFDAIHQKEFPGGKDQILIMGAKKGDERLYNLGSNNIPIKDLERYRDQVKQGQAKIIRIYDPDSHPLSEFSDVAGNNRVRYVLSYETDTKPLDFNHVNRRGGGHFDVDADHYVKQANMVNEMAGSVGNDKRNLYARTYTGDTTLMPVNNRVMGKDIARRMNEINKHIDSGNYAEAERASSGLGIEWKEIENWYKPSRGPGGKVLSPRLNPKEPFYVVPRNKKIIDLGKDLQDRHGDFFRDGTKTGSDAQQFQVAYNQVRDVNDLYTLKDEGSQGNPLYKYIPAEYVDPIPTMNRALNRAINSTFTDDYKMYAVEHWLQEAIPHMKLSEDEVRSAPFYHFNNASALGSFTSGTDEATKWNLMSNRMKIQQFLGTPNKIDTAIHGLTQMLVDQLYGKLGPYESRGIIGKASEIIPLWALARAKDPVSTIRSFAFNAKLGLFALPQLLVQAQTFTSIWALSPKHGASGTLATLLHQWSRINSNPEILKSLDSYASKVGFKPGEWMEAREELGRTAFEHPAGEYAMSDDALNSKPIKNTWGNFLDAGQVFFREGERAVRLGAYYTAFREFRDVNPTKVLTDVDRASILNRADLLTTNMSRASSSILHGGVLSLPTQFLSYQLRMAEMFLGKRIGETTTERTLARGRLIAFYAAMYGAPSALGITGYPFGDSIREAALNGSIPGQGGKPYVVGEKFIDSLIMEGIPAMTMNLITGGNNYNIGPRFGSAGFTSLAESFRSDKNVYDIIGGAGGSILMNTIAAADPFWNAMKSVMSPDEEGNQYKLSTSDLADVFNEVSSVDAARRWYKAMNTGQWINKNEQVIDDVSVASATFMALTGTKPQEQDDIYHYHNIQQAEKADQAAEEKHIVKDYQRAVQAYNDNDPDTGDQLMKRVRARMISSRMPLDMQSEVLATASKGYEKQIETSKQNWATRHVPAGQEENRLDALSRSLQLRNQ